MKVKLVTYLSSAFVIAGSLASIHTVYGQVVQTPEMNPTVAAQNGSGSTWVNPANAELIDHKYAKTTLGSICGSVSSPCLSEYLTLEGFHFTIPTGSTINGITVNVVGHDSVLNSQSVSLYVQLMQNGSPVGTKIDAGTMLPAPDDTTTAGGCNSISAWGGTWNSADIDSSGFGVSLNVTSKFSWAFIDNVNVSVCYQIVKNGITTYTQNSSGTIVYPNPSSGLVYTGATGKYEFSVYDVCGNLSYKSILEGPQHVNLAFLSNGVYFVRTSSDDSVNTQKLIIQK